MLRIVAPALLWPLLIGLPNNAVYAQTEASWCGTLMCVDASMDNGFVTYKLTALNQLGWMSIGFGSQMSNSPLVILWPNGDGTITMSQRIATGHTPPQIDPSPLRVASVSRLSDLSSDTTPVLAFDLPNDGNISDVQSLVWAFGVSRPPASSSAQIEQHLDAGSFSLDFRQNGKAKDDPSHSSEITSSTPSGSTASPVVSQTSSLPLSPSLSTSPSASVTPAPDNNPPTSPSTPNEDPKGLRSTLAAHALLSFSGFCVFLPAAALVARWCRTITPLWLRAHWMIIAALAIPSISIGWALGPVVVSERGRQHVVNEHQIFGVVLFALCLLEVTLGVFIHLRPPKNVHRAHPSRNIAHVSLGLLIIALSFYETATGIKRDWSFTAATKRNLYILCAFWAAIIAIAYLSGLTRLRRQFDQEQLAWQLTMASDAAPPRGILNLRPHRSRRSFSAGRHHGDRSARHVVTDVFSQTNSRPRTSSHTDASTPLVEMRELQSPVPISVRI